MTLVMYSPYLDRIILCGLGDASANLDVVLAAFESRIQFCLNSGFEVVGVL